MKILFIGGTGIISSGCLQPILDRGDQLYLFNRGQSTRPVPPQAQVLHGDIRNPASVRSVLQNMDFDVVVNWVTFTLDQVEQDIDFFAGRTGQYVFISSASAYQKPAAFLPIRESTPLYNPIWQYSREKIACEERLTRAYREQGFPMTIVRPSHTYGPSYIPLHGGYTMLERIRQGRKVIIHGDGTSLWVLTHHTDFAKGFVGLLGNSHALGESFHITSDELLTWNSIHELFARALGVELNPVHIPSDFIAARDRIWGDSLLGDKAHSVIFDNTKIKTIVPGFAATIPFSRGVEEIVAYHAADRARQVVDPAFDAILDQMIADYEGVRAPAERA